MNTIMIDGEIIKTGPTPYALLHLGFTSADEVRAVAAKFSEGTPYMKMNDVVEYFEKCAY